MTLYGILTGYGGGIAHCYILWVVCDYYRARWNHHAWNEGVI